MDSEEFTDAPRLRGAATWRVRRIAVEDFRQMADASAFHNIRGGAPNRHGRWKSLRPIYMHQRFAVERHLPGPCRSVVVGGFTMGVFIARILSPIRMIGIVQQLAVAHDAYGNRNIGGCQRADRPWHEQTCAVRENVHGGCRMVEDIC